MVSCALGMTSIFGTLEKIASKTGKYIPGNQFIEQGEGEACCEYITNYFHSFLFLIFLIKECSLRVIYEPLRSSPGYSMKSDKMNSTNGRLPMQIAVINASLVDSADVRSVINESSRSI